MVDVSAKLIDSNEITPQSNYVWIYSNGTCTWEPRFELSASHCDVDVTWFPFDVQRCQLNFESWILMDDQLTITTKKNDALRHYVPSEEWTLTCACSRTTHYFFTTGWSEKNPIVSRIRISTSEWSFKLFYIFYFIHYVYILASLLSNSFSFAEDMGNYVICSYRYSWPTNTSIRQLEKCTIIKSPRIKLLISQ